MPEAADLIGLGNAAIVAPAGHGKTELIAKVAALGKRSLVLTHTHAGVHAIRARLKRLGIPQSAVAVDTIAGWSTRYSHAFPNVAKPCDGLPASSAEWNQLYIGAKDTLRVNAVRQVVESSYDRILIDEYQDCDPFQHDLAVELSNIVPTLIFGDPMQGIFEFAGATLSWEETIHPHFPFVGTLDTPHRWQGKNEALGEWIAQTRGKLMRGEEIDLAAGPIVYRQADNAFEMGTFFDGIDGKEGSFAAIHCNKGICYRLASAAGGGYQAIEEIAAKRLQQFAVGWDQANSRQARVQAVTELSNECFVKRALAEGEIDSEQDIAHSARMNAASRRFAEFDGAQAAVDMFATARLHSRWKLFRSELWREAGRALSEVAEGRCETMIDAADRMRQRASIAGRKLPKRTVSTPLLLKGLEFDHVVIPHASHMNGEQRAQAKLFYVAISRATRTLTISSPERFIRFPAPAL